MSHHLTPDRRREIHEQHVKADRGHVSRLIQLAVTDNLTQLVANIHFETCLTCGLLTPVDCDHGASFWTHRPGCPKFDPAVFGGVEPPEGLYETYTRGRFGNVAVNTQDPTPTGEGCDGCLLVCPLCRADGT